MNVQFWPCPACARHVKRGDLICPFCGADASSLGGLPRTVVRASRSVLFAAGALGGALAAADCDVQSNPPYGLAPIGSVTYPTPMSGSTAAGPSTIAPDASDARATSELTDAPNVSADSSTDAPAASDSPTAADVPTVLSGDGAPIPVEAQDAIDESPSVVALYGAFAPVDAEAETND
jgi:hypothetical protein